MGISRTSPGRKVGIIHPVIRFCGECPYARTIVTHPSQIAPGKNKVANFPHDFPVPVVNTGVWWWFCGRTGAVITDLSKREGACPLQARVQAYYDMDKGNARNEAPDDEAVGPEER